MLLIFGGASDPQIARFRKRAALAGVPHRDILHGEAPFPTLRWDLATQALTDDDGEISFTSAFVRQDVFRYLATKQDADRDEAAAWKVMLDAIILADPTIKVFNRGFIGKAGVNKPLALIQAKHAGLEIPQTIIHSSRQMGIEMAESETVYKPIDGGDMCKPLDPEAIQRTARLRKPYIFQERLISPELRVFRVGEQFFGYDVAADALDYRSVGPDAIITPTEVPEGLIAPLKTLTDTLGLTFAAADFKMSPKDGSFKFLEVNSGPMFAAFDIASDGALIDAMIAHLTT